MQVASGDYLSGGAIVFNGVKTDVRGAPGLGDGFQVSPSVGGWNLTRPGPSIVAVRPIAPA